MEPAKTLEAVKNRALELQAQELSNPLSRVTTPAIDVAPAPNTRVADAVSRDLAQVVSAQTQEAADLRKARNEFAQISDLGSLANFRTDREDAFGLPETTRQLKDIQLQLSERDTDSAVTRSQIGAAAGQTLGQAQREVTQEDRENAIRRAGLAAQASVLQGNIETARSLVNDAVNTEFQQRQIDSQNLINQISDLRGTVDAQTQQLLDAQLREEQTKLARIQEVKDAVNAAMLSGATPQEVAQLTSTSLSDNEKLAVAQSVIAGAALEDRALDRTTKQLQQANIRSQIGDRQARLEMAQETLRQQTAQSAGTPEVIAAETEQALQVRELANELLSEAGLGAAVGFGFGKSVRGSIPFVGEAAISGTARADFEAKAERLANLLTLDNLDLMSGVLSETDIKILESAGSNLKNFTQSEDQYLEEVNRVISVMERNIANNGITTEQAVFYGLVDDEEAGELDLIFN